MKKIEGKKFNIPKLKGISEKNIEEHLKLYSGYVKNANLILEQIEDLSANYDKFSYAISEIQRKFGFEYDGIKNHELYFSQLEGGSNGFSNGSQLKNAIIEEWGDFTVWLGRFKNIALTRGIGWAILYFDPKEKRLFNCWIDEQHIGHLTGLFPILALDMWEHSFVYDYQPSGKKNYIEDFFLNLNWQRVEDNFLSIVK